MIPKTAPTKPERRTYSSACLRKGMTIGQKEPAKQAAEYGPAGSLNDEGSYPAGADSDLAPYLFQVHGRALASFGGIFRDWSDVVLPGIPRGGSDFLLPNVLYFVPPVFLVNRFPSLVSVRLRGFANLLRIRLGRVANLLTPISPGGCSLGRGLFKEIDHGPADSKERRDTKRDCQSNAKQAEKYAECRPAECENCKANQGEPQRLLNKALRTIAAVGLKRAFG